MLMFFALMVVPITIVSAVGGVGATFASIDPAKAPTTYAVTFTVTNGDAAVADAKVTMSGVTKTTDATGKAVFNCVPGKYTYTVKKEGASMQKGSTVVEAKAVSVAVTNFA
jgi:hypothetical protein